MIPAWIVALFSLTTAVGLLREAQKKTQPHYKARWACMSLPFFYQTGVYLWVYLLNPPLTAFAPFARSGYFIIALTASFYFLLDLIHDIKQHWSRRNGLDLG